MPTDAERLYARQYYAARKAADPGYGNGAGRPRSAAQWDWHLRHRYGIDGAEFVRMFEEQGCQCSVCGSPLWDDCHVDHCHTTGKVRGLLCRACNHGLGNFKDNPAALRRAANYVEAPT